MDAFFFKFNDIKLIFNPKDERAHNFFRNRNFSGCAHHCMPLQRMRILRSQG